ncbi:Phenylalanine N-monooxygenase [Vitis vinifera]|nr:Phenylalanine N-monooxygenase [Vitis vinifera]
MSSSSNSTLFSSILFLSPANDAAIDDVLSHLTFLLMLFIISVILIFTKFKSKTSTNSKSMMLPPGPAPWPLVRNLPHLLNKKPTFRWIHGFMKEMNTEIACIQLGDVHVIPMTSPEISREF